MTPGNISHKSNTLYNVPDKKDRNIIKLNAVACNALGGGFENCNGLFIQ